MEKNANTLLITYGVTSRAAREAVNDEKRHGKPVSHLVLKTLWPVPDKVIREKSENVKRVVVVEMNLGQYVREIKRILTDKKVDFYGQMNGELITPKQIRKVL